MFYFLTLIGFLVNIKYRMCLVNVYIFIVKIKKITIN